MIIVCPWIGLLQNRKMTGKSSSAPCRNRLLNFRENILFKVLECITNHVSAEHAILGGQITFNIHKTFYFIRIAFGIQEYDQSSHTRANQQKSIQLHCIYKRLQNLDKGVNVERMIHVVRRSTTARVVICNQAASLK